MGTSAPAEVEILWGSMSSSVRFVVNALGKGRAHDVRPCGWVVGGSGGREGEGYGSLISRHGRMRHILILQLEDLLHMGLLLVG